MPAVKDFGGTVEYIHLNPVRRGLVKRPERWKELNERFGESLRQTPSRSLAEAAAQKCDAAAEKLGAVYVKLDELEDYEETAVREGIEKFREISRMFADERMAAAGAAEVFTEKEGAADGALLPVLEQRAEAYKDRPASAAEIFRDFREQFLIELSRR